MCYPFRYVDGNLQNHRCISALQTRARLPLSIYLIEAHFNAYANRGDPDQAYLVRAA